MIAKQYRVCAGSLLISIWLLSAQEGAAQASYLGSQACVDCHAEATEAWRGSHHARAWTEATSDNIVADFDGTRFSIDGMTARFRRTPNGQYRINVTEKDGRSTDYPVHSVVGVEPLQQYLIETEPGKLQSFDVVWDTEKGGWFHLYPDQELPPDDGLHWTGPYKNWNARCAECHATGFEKNYDAGSRTYASTQVEIGVGCEACHGPGGDHVTWALATTQQAPPANYGFAVDFSDAEAGLEQCATCHSRREAHLDGNPPPGTSYDDSYALALLRPGLYHADGQILDEVYVYGSFLQSKMYARGVTCGDCHTPHAASLKADGNAVCTQCHAPSGKDTFPTLTGGLYDSPEHHFHPQGSEAAQCKSCHMTERVYMGNDWRGDHSFRVPRPDLSPQTGAPNACTGCHSEQGDDWAAAEIAARFPDASRRGPHYGLTLSRGRENPGAAAADLASLALDSDQAGIVRATALWLLEQSGSEAAAARTAVLLGDSDPLVRAAAVGVQRLAPPQDRVLNAIDLLADPERSVRIAAARALLDAPIARLPGAINTNMRAAMADWQVSLSNRLDFPEAHIQLAGIALTMRNMAAADQAFGEVVRLDPQRQEAWVMRVRIAAALGDRSGALDLAEEALRVLPGDPALLDMRAALQGEVPSLLPPPAAPRE